MPEILILYYSEQGSTAELAHLIARGCETVPGASAKLRTVAPLTMKTDTLDSAPQTSLEDLRNCDGLIMGSPAFFGNMAAPLKHFLDTSAAIWLAGELAGKPAAVFTTSSSLHGGQEAALLSMLLPLLHHGMLLVGLPYTQPALRHTRSGGTPYGASHVQQTRHIAISEDEKTLAIALGKRVAEIAVKLKQPAA